jgi:hypothetical protein
MVHPHRQGEINGGGSKGIAKGRDLMAQVGGKLARRPHRIKVNLMVSAVCEPTSGERASAINRYVVAWKHRRPQFIEEGWETP